MDQPTISLEDFVAKLIAEKPKKKGSTTTSITTITTTTTTIKRGNSRWTNEAIVLYIHEVTCIHCKKIYTAPAHVPFLRRIHPTLGVHAEAINHPINAEEYIALPKIMETVQLTAKMCQSCWRPEDLTERFKQQELDFSEIFDQLIDPEFSPEPASFDEELEEETL